MQETGPPAYFGEWLKLRRKALDLTQAELAGRANCSLPGLRKIEGGERRPSALLAKLLGQALEVPAEELDTFVKVARGELNLERLRAPGSLRPAVPAPYQESPRSRLNLPVEPTPFIGRETELATLDRLLADPQCRLLTVMGMGGMGKTRLVIELASRRQDHFPGGAYFVSLASLSSPDYIIPAIAEAAGLTFSGSSQPRQQLFNYLEFHTRRAMLLVLDNLEHLLALPGQAAAGEDAAALMAEMLHRAPALKLLVTSRERVNIQGEWVFELQGLPYPADEESFNLEAYSAPALFVQRARQVKIDFEVLPDERPALLSVCELTEGTPLAIELAAAWVGVLSLDEIAREIAANLEFLASSMRDMPERHRSMRVVFDQSWKMLSTGEQQALSQLSVFQGGFSRQAAEQVAGATLPVLSALADWSLLRRTGPGRYDMHELVRQYGALRLAANPRELEKTRQRHFDFFLALAETAARELKGGRPAGMAGQAGTGSRQPESRPGLGA